MKASLSAAWGGPPPSIEKLLREGSSYSGDTMAISQKLRGYQNSLAEPYFKTKQAAVRPRPGDAAEVVGLRKQVSAMSRDFQSLLSTHERQEAAAMGLRQQVRALRQELEGREKALDLARRTVERLSADKGQLETAAAGTQAYVRKLESRLLAVKHSAELEQRCAQLKSQLDQQTHALSETEARAGAAEEAAASAQLDAACLKRGLELAAEQLTRFAGTEVPGTLLKAVARGQEEALGMSVQLSDAKTQLAQLTAALEQAREHLSAQQGALGAQQAERQALQQRAEAAEAALEKQQAVTRELRRVLDALRPKAGALAEERAALRQQLEEARTLADDAAKEAKQLRTALRQKAATEAALRDELRRALAGEGFTPSPAGQRTREAAAPMAAAAAQPAARSGSRAGSNSRQQQHGSAAAAQPSKPVGPAALPSSARPKSAKPGLRQASAWEEQVLRARPASSGGAMPAEPPPARALLRLQEQRQRQQSSRLGAPTQQQEQPASWDATGAEWGASGQADGELLSPPSSSGRASQHAQQQPDAAALNRHETQAHSSALDQQIALLESDLAQLDAAASPIAQLCKAAAEARSPALAFPRWQQQQPGLRQPRVGIAAWRPNGVFHSEAQQPAAAVGAVGQYLLSPGATPAHGAGLAAGRDESPVPAIWHSNPLASPPAKQPQLQLEAAGGGATTVRALHPLPDAAAAAGPAALTPAPAAAEDGDDEEWQWESSAVASSPSLRLPAQPQASAGQVQQQQQAVSQGSCGGGGGVESLSQQWDLPSLGAGNTTDWLSNPEWQADIEQLEVTSTPRKEQASAPASPAHARGSPAAQQQALEAQWAQAEAALRPASGGSDGSSGWGGSEAAWEGAPLMGHGHSDPDHQRRRAPPLLPGLPLVADASPQPAAPAAPASPQVQAVSFHQKAAAHSLFDLAGMDLSELL